MNVRGTVRWGVRETYYSQENNPTEAYNKAVLHNRDSWLESCGPTAAVTCLAAMGIPVRVRCPGDYEPQPEEVLMDFFNDPRNGTALKRIRKVSDDIPENRVPQYYPYGVRRVFGVGAEFHWGLDYGEVSRLVSEEGLAVQLCRKRPGHYIAVVAFDSESDELIYNDPWPSQFSDKNGFNRRMHRDEYETNVQPYYIVYGV